MAATIDACLTVISIPERFRGVVAFSVYVGLNMRVNFRRSVTTLVTLSTGPSSPKSPDTHCTRDSR